MLSERGVERWEKTGILRPGRAEISADGLIVGGHLFFIFCDLVYCTIAVPSQSCGCSATNYEQDLHSRATSNFVFELDGGFVLMPKVLDLKHKRLSSELLETRHFQPHVRTRIGNWSSSDRFVLTVA